MEKETDNRDNFWHDSLIGCFSYIIGILAGLLMAVLLAGCTTTKYVPVPEVHHDTVRITQQQRDSIHVHDSIYVSERQQGDTVFLQTVKWHTAWRDRLVRDTFRLVSIDSIPYPVEVPVEVPAKLSYWQRLRMQTGDIALIALALFLGWGAFRLWRRIN